MMGAGVAPSGTPPNVETIVSTAGAGDAEGLFLYISAPPTLRGTQRVPGVKSPRLYFSASPTLCISALKTPDP